MKREAITHTKMKRLCRRLCIPIWQAVGLLESVWHLTARETPQGDIGKLTNDDIALAIEYGKDARDAAELIEALAEAGWIDQHPKYRLVVHDWSEHADDAVHLRLARARQHFADGRSPKLTRLGGKERKAAEDFYAACRHSGDPCARTRDPHAVRTPSAPPEPEPRQSQSPAPPEARRPAVGAVHISGETTTSTPTRLAELMPTWLDAEAQRNIWQACRTHAPDSTPEEVAAATAQKVGLLGRTVSTGLVISGVPKMFEAPSGFLRDHRRDAQLRATEQERQRQELQRIANDETETAESRRWAAEMLNPSKSAAA